jgi:hypothetical protein
LSHEIKFQQRCIAAKISALHKPSPLCFPVRWGVKKAALAMRRILAKSNDWAGYALKSLLCISDRDKLLSASVVRKRRGATKYLATLLAEIRDTAMKVVFRSLPLIAPAVAVAASGMERGEFTGVFLH